MTAYAGVDTSFFPGLATMRDLKTTLRPDWTGYYLRAPSHPDPGWMGQRAALAALGYGLLPIWVGEEAYGPGQHQVDGEHGLAEGAAAAAALRGDGFPAGAYGWLDVEGGGPVTKPMRDYILAWAHGMDAAGFGLGLYGSHLIAAELAQLVPAARIWAVKVGLPITAHPFNGAALHADPPAGSGYPAAYAWQREENAILSFSGRRLQVDLSSALTADPSAP